MLTNREKVLGTAFLVGILASGACGYRLRGTGNFLFAAHNIKRIVVPVFKNNTTRFELDLKLTRAVINEFVTRGRVEIITDQAVADAVLEGEVASFNVNPIGFSSQQSTADRYLIQIVANILIRDSRSKKVIFANPSFVWSTEYEVPQGTNFEASETEALNKVSDTFARALVIMILEGF